MSLSTSQPVFCFFLGSQNLPCDSTIRARNIAPALIVLTKLTHARAHRRQPQSLPQAAASILAAIEPLAPQHHGKLGIEGRSRQPPPYTGRGQRGQKDNKHAPPREKTPPQYPLLAPTAPRGSPIAKRLAKNAPRPWSALTLPQRVV